MREKVFKSVLLVLIGVVFFGCSSIERKIENSEYIKGSINATQKNSFIKIDKFLLNDNQKYLLLRSDSKKIQILNLKTLKFFDIKLSEKKMVEEKSKQTNDFIVYDDELINIKAIQGEQFHSTGFSLTLGLDDVNLSVPSFNPYALGLVSIRNTFSFYNNLLAYYDGRDIIVIELESNQILKKFRVEKDMDSFSFTLDNDFIIFYEDKYIKKKINIKSGERTYITDEVYTKEYIANKNFKVLKNNDGSVSIHNIKTNKKLLTIKLFKNKNRGKSVTILGQEYENANPDSWLAITPEGYYVGSPDAYKYFDVDKYYEKFYRPEIVKLALQGETIDGLTKISDIKSPPQVEILNGVEETSKESIEIKVAVTAKNGGLGKIQIFRNGTSIAFETRAFQHQQKENFKTYDVPLVKGVNEIKAVAFESTNSASSESNVYAIRSTYQKPHKQSIHALIVGIEKFDNGRFDLKNTVADAKIFKDILNIQKNKGLFHDVNIVLLNTKAKTRKKSILSELKKMRTIHPEDLFVFYVGSHGEINNDGKYYLIPSDIDDDSVESIKKNAISEDDIKEYIGNIPTAQKFIVFDTCKAGSIAGSLSALESTKQTKGVDDKTALNTLSHSVGSGAMIMGASTAKEVANEKYKEHGLFTYVLVEGLRGKAEKNGEPNIQSSELKNYVYKNVKEISSSLETMPTQTPIINDIGEPFSISGGR